MHSEKITAFYQALIKASEPSGPLARMVRISAEEQQVHAGECDDPIGDRAHARCAQGRLIHRYPDRVLLLVTDRCPAHCRFCFRKQRIEAGAGDVTDAELEAVVGYLGAHPAVKEVILSGGDPLSLSDSRLLEIVRILKGGAGVETLRIHTRYPVYEPARCAGLEAVAAQVDVFVLHVNHRRELSPDFGKAMAVLRGSALLLSQSVLLKGVNDTVPELEALVRGLAAVGILPYYLHYPDRARGTEHFRMPIEAAMALVETLQGNLPGYRIPKLVLDIPGGHGKVELSRRSIRRLSPGRYELTSPISGLAIEYREDEG